MKKTPDDLGLGVPGRGNTKYKDLGRTSLACSRNSWNASVAEI